jgi:hypothetical protein
MRKQGLKLFTIAILTSMMLGYGANTLHGRMPFQKEFLDKYYKPKSDDPREKALAAALDAMGKQKCNTCHVAGKLKPERNPYGQELDKLLNKADQGNPKKIQEALEKVSGIQTDPTNPQSPTFGDRLKKGALPGG